MVTSLANPRQHVGSPPAPHPSHYKYPMNSLCFAFASLLKELEHFTLGNPFMVYYPSNKFYFTSIDICMSFVLASIIYSWGGGFIPTDVSHTYKILFIYLFMPINLILVNRTFFWKMLKACLNFFCVQCRYLCNILYLCIIDNIKVSIM